MPSASPALHLAAFLREHGYEGAQDAAARGGRRACRPTRWAPANERLLLELARRGAVVAAAGPDDAAELHRQPALVFLGVRGQLDPSRGQGAARRVISVATLAGGLLVRRLQGRPVPWVRRATLRPRRPRDAAEELVALLLRALARQVSLEEAWEDLPAHSPHAR